MSTAIVEAEIKRFLSTPTPEVLCISGQWGVGKTFAWQRFFKASASGGKIGLRDYAYVSLFGLNSLNDLRNSITENTISSSDSPAVPSASKLYARLKGTKKYILRNRPVMEIAAGFFRMKDAGDALYRAAFLMVRNQIICFDDLERAGDGLKIKDVLGLASSLKEQRGCKIVLLLNKEQICGDEVNDLNNQLEKVVDTFLVFEPTSAEATSIGISGDDKVAKLLRERMMALGISNIRVMKKIERSARQLEAVLATYDARIMEQAISTVVLAGWSFLQPAIAPSADVIRSYNSYGSIRALVGNGAIDEQTRQWNQLIENYGYTNTDELDLEIISGVSVGYFDANILRKIATEINERLAREQAGSKFSDAWRLYHESLVVGDDEVLRAIFEGAIESPADISLGNIDGAAKFLRTYGWKKQASELVKACIKANASNPEFFSLSNRIFVDGPVDEELFAGIEAQRTAISDTRDPAAVLARMVDTSGFNPEQDVALFSKLSVAELVALFDENPGRKLKGMVVSANSIANQPGADALRKNLSSAFKQIAERSPMRANRLRLWGVFAG